MVLRTIMRKIWRIVRGLMAYVVDNVLLVVFVLPFGILLWPLLAIIGLCRRPKVFVGLIKSFFYLADNQMWVLSKCFGFKDEFGPRPTLETVVVDPEGLIARIPW